MADYTLTITMADGRVIRCPVKTSFTPAPVIPSPQAGERIFVHQTLGIVTEYHPVVRELDCRNVPALEAPALAATPGLRAADDFATIRAAMATIKREASPRHQLDTLTGAELDALAERVGVEPRKEGEPDYCLKDRMIAHLGAAEQ